MANLKERNIALVSKDSEGVTTIDYPLTSAEMVEGLEEFVKTHSTPLTLPLPLNNGGTGADNAEVARKNLGLAIVASSGDYNDLSNKPSIPVKPNAYIVETYRNGTEWYRVWSDGWLEQGGTIQGNRKTITLLNPYADANYCVYTTPSELISNDSSNGTGYAPYCFGITTTRFKISAYNQSTRYTFWYACGMGA